MSERLELAPLYEGVFEVCSHVKMGPGVIFPARSTILQLEGGGVMIHSPLSFDEELASKVSDLGEVRYLVAPSLFHNRYIKRCAALFPNAQILAPQGTEKSIGPLNYLALDAGGFPEELASDLSCINVEGASKAKESVFFHPRSGSIIVTDLFFNMGKLETWMGNLLGRLMGNTRPQAQSRLWRILNQDKAAFAQSMDAIAALPAQRLIMAHGAPIEGDLSFIQRETAWARK